jgi:hypothetical protein
VVFQKLIFEKQTWPRVSYNKSLDWQAFVCVFVEEQIYNEFFFFNLGDVWSHKLFFKMFLIENILK